MPAAESPNILSGLTVEGLPNLIDGLDVVDPGRCKAPKRSAESVDPRVIDTYPAYGAVVPSGPVMLRATFDQPMNLCSYSIRVQHAQDLEFVDAPVLMTPDHRTFLFILKLAPGADFELSFNAPGGVAEPSYRGFRSQSGGYGIPHVLVFRSSVTTASKSLLEASRRDPAFDALNRMPGRLIRLGKSRWDGPLVPTKH